MLLHSYMAFEHAGSVIFRMTSQIATKNIKTRSEMHPEFFLHKPREIPSLAQV